MSKLSIRKPNGSIGLPDNNLWQNRFEIRSETSNRVYVVSQNKKTLNWACSCPGYVRHRVCKHLTNGCGLDESEIHGNKHAIAKSNYENLE